MMLQRLSRVHSVAVTASLATTGQIPYHDMSGGRVHIPAGSSITSLTWYDATDLGGTFLAAYDSAATPAAITQTVSAEKSYPIPVDLFGARVLKVVGNAEGTVTISLKG